MSCEKLKTMIDLIHKNMYTNDNKFDVLVQNIESHIEGTSATNMIELKEKTKNKKKKGDLFESFCFLYLQKILQHDEVWFYKDFPSELKTQFHLTKNDYGIDLISKKGEGYYAIQCKYRKPQDMVQTISWKSLSTFYAMVSKSGPWIKHITMTNVNGCRHIGEKTEKDWSICIGTFRGMKHFDWLTMIDAGSESTPVKTNKGLNKNELRDKRLEFYCK
jgi:hypothetical protein